MSEQPPLCLDARLVATADAGSPCAVGVLLMATLFATLGGGPLEQRTIPLSPRAPGALIVGRAVCASTTWLLTAAADLVAVTDRPPAIRVRRLTGLRADDRPWGLACVTGSVLWTLSSPRTLARVVPDGAIVERIELDRPRIALFGAETRLLFQQLPIPDGAPVLHTSRPGSANPQAWAGLVSRPAATPEARLRLNLVACGIGSGGTVPCWFADQSRVSLSNGTDARAVAVPGLQTRPVNQSTPIADVALVAGDRLWVLAATRIAGQGQPAGERLLYVDHRGTEISRIDLGSAARLIVAADASRCLLLSLDGNVIEVYAR